MFKKKKYTVIRQAISKVMPEIEWSVHAPYIHKINKLKKEKTFTGPEQLLQVYVVDTTGGENSLIITDQLRKNGFKVDRSFGDRSMKAQMKAADKSGAKIALIVGEDEVEKGVVTIRDLRGEEGQEEIASDSIIANLEKRLR